MAKSSISLNVRNWIGDTRTLSLEARGLLIELMCHMYKEPDMEIPPPPGTERMQAKDLALLVSANENDVLVALEELFDRGFVSYTLTGHLACKLIEKRKPPQAMATPAELQAYHKAAEEIYAAWSRPGDRKESLRAVVRLLGTKVITPEELARRAQVYCDAHKDKDPDFIKKLVRWINGNIWEECAEKDKTTGSASDEFNKLWGQAKK